MLHFGSDVNQTVRKMTKNPRKSAEHGSGELIMSDQCLIMNGHCPLACKHMNADWPGLRLKVDDC